MGRARGYPATWIMGPDGLGPSPSSTQPTLRVRLPPRQRRSIGVLTLQLLVGGAIGGLGFLTVVLYYQLVGVDREGGRFEPTVERPAAREPVVEELLPVKVEAVAVEPPAPAVPRPSAASASPVEPIPVKAPAVKTPAPALAAPRRSVRRSRPARTARPAAATPRAADRPSTKGSLPADWVDPFE